MKSFTESLEDTHELMKAHSPRQLERAHWLMSVKYLMATSEKTCPSAHNPSASMLRPRWSRRSTLRR